MKGFSAILIIAFITLTAATCNQKGAAENMATSTKCYKGKLAIKGICQNYVIQVLQGDTSALQLEKTWIDESNDKTYTNVFALASKCSFPDMAEGDEFYFTVTDKDSANCNVCMAYRPVPNARNNIVVLKAPCP